MSDHRTDRHQRIAALFAELIDEPEPARHRRLEALRRNDPAIASELQALLDADAEPSLIDHDLDLSWTDAHADAPPDPTRLPDTQHHADQWPRHADLEQHHAIGPYQLLGVLGRGGMGVVYKAQQHEPRRLVALKLVKSSLLAPDAAKRLRFEANVLARLTHPGIAQVYDAGSLHDGPTELSYFAMQLVDGQSLVRFADDESLPINERVRLLASVCDAVQHAHRHGVIHRDLKPDNILVDAERRPRVLDFGIARLLEPDVHVTTAGYGDAALLGTLAYMSPEQLDGDPARIDARSDVYALGAILYQLLTGRTPVPLDGLTLTQAVDALRTRRPISPRQLNTRVPRDLETVTLKALEPNADRRYGSADELAADLRRLLNREPVHARPATLAYKGSRFAQRNPGLCAGIAAALLLLLVAIAGVLFGYAESVRRAQTLEAANANIAEQARRAEAVNTFLRSMLVSADPLGETGRGRADMTVVELLDRESDQIEQAFADLPESEASVRSTIGNVYLSLGRFDRAEPHLRRSIELHDQVWGVDSPDADRARRDLAVLLAETERDDEAVAIFDDILNRQINAGRDHDLEHAITAARYGAVLLQRADFKLAQRWLTVALQRFEREGVQRVDALPSVLNNLARARSGLGDRDAAEKLYVRARDAFAELHGPDHAAVAIADNNVATLRFARGDYHGAARSFTRVVRILANLMGDHHPTVATVRHNLGSALFELQRFDEALDALNDAAHAYAASYGSDHTETLATRMAAADILLELQRFDDAEQAFHDIATRWLDADPNEPRAHRARFYRGVALAQLNRRDEAQRLMTDAHHRYRQLAGLHTPTGQRLTRELAQYHADADRLEHARQLASELDPNNDSNRELLDRLNPPASPE